MKVVIFGGSGLIGQGVLLQALDHGEVESVLSVGRRELEVDHPKLRQVVHGDFEDFAPLADELSGLDACFWCLGRSSSGMDEAAYTRLTYDFTMAAARVLRERSPDLCFCFVSGAGTDATEKGRVMWARVKGRTENALSEMGFRAVYLFRPALIRSRRVKHPHGTFTRLLTAALYPLFRPFGGATTNTAIGDAMLAVSSGAGAGQRILTTRDINRLAAGRPLRSG